MDQQHNDEYKAPAGDLGSDLDFDLDDEDFDDDSGDLMRILGIAGGIAALIGGLLIIMGRRRKTPAEQLMENVRSTGKDVRKAVGKADLGELLAEARDQANSRLRDANLGDLARDVRHGGRGLARSAGEAVSQVDLQDTIDEIGRRLATIEREGRRGAGRAQKEARKALNDVDLSGLSDDMSGRLSDLWDGITERAKDVGWEEAIGEAGKQIRQLSKQARRSGNNLDLSGLADVLDNIKSQLGSAGERVQKDVLPAVQGTLEDARKRGGKLADEYGPQIKKEAGKTAKSAQSLTEQVGDMLRVVALDALDRLMGEVLPGAKKGGERVADTLRDDTFPWLRHRAGEARDRVRDDVAPKVRDAASAAPGTIRDAVDTARPVVGDALSSAAGSVGDAMSHLRPAVGDAVDSGRDALHSGGSGIGGALGNVGQKAGDAVGATFDTTKYVTGETSRILFWLSILGGLILVVFVPDAEKQKEIWHNMQGFFGELRNMWGDFSEGDANEQDYTGDAGV
ncbi:MAG: hypothetical protein ACR2M0_03425 [Chloroflexia bacterium]